MSNPADSETYAFDWPVFPKDETQKELNITEVAMREGADGFPGSDSKILSMTENEIVGRVRRFYVSALEKISDEFVGLGEEAANIKNFLERFDIRQSPVQLKARVESELTDARVRMRGFVLNAKIASENFQIFKRENQLTREPLYSKSWMKIWAPGIVVLLFGLEVILNGALASGAVDGLIAGFSVATTVATVNVILSFIVGKSLLPELNRRDGGALKWAAAAGIFLHGVVILYLNLVFGVFRSIAMSARNIRAWEDVQTTEAFIKAFKPWEALANIDVPSLFVVGVGIVFAVIALIDGYKYDDVYPGYGDVHRKFLAASEPFENQKKEVGDRVFGVVDRACAEMERAIAEYETKMTRWSVIQNTVRQQLASYAAWMAQSEQDANKLLNDYRAANIKGRHSNYSVKSPPAYFESKWSFTDEEKDPSKKFSHLAFLISDGAREFENKNFQVQQEMNSTRDQCVVNLQRFMQEIQEEFDKK